MRLTRTFPRWLSFIISPTFVTGPTRHSRENTIETRVAKLLYIHPNSTAVNRTPELCRVSLQISCFCFPDVPTQTLLASDTLGSPARGSHSDLSLSSELFLENDYQMELPVPSAWTGRTLPSIWLWWLIPLGGCITVDLQRHLFKSSPFLFHALTLFVSCCFFH